MKRISLALLFAIIMNNCISQRFNDSVAIYNLKFENRFFLPEAHKLNLIGDSLGWVYLIKYSSFNVYIKMKDAKIFTVLKDSIQPSTWRIKSFYSKHDDNLVLDSLFEYNASDNHLWSKHVYKNDFEIIQITYAKKGGAEERLLSERNANLYYHKDFFCNSSLMAEGEYNRKLGKRGIWKYYDLSGKLIAKGRHKYWYKRIPYDDYNFQNVNDTTCTNNEIVTIVTRAIYYYKYGLWYNEENGIKFKTIYYKDKKIVTIYKKHIK